ncbi:hypothetical protein FW774_10580 [Pedobacter sp. BS3]|uniref:hypothetical protein n=1 Tax=Pedobacter sp. BS3 TaxID=2567937 RepID=UPI0011EC8BCD|nr:hypothetical protein [Pedobacter sp. BS3]TZF83897.1 hypothetical protein FW774_10580 [Pedobacter sp. BS3]
MKRIIAIIALACVASFFVISCSSTRNTSGTSVSRGKITGTWTVSTVNYENLLENAVQSAFNQAPPRDFVGSTWKLTNSGNGMYTLTNGTSQSIYWSLYEQSDMRPMFQFKKVYQGEKPKDIDEAYRLEIGTADGNNLVLKIPVPYGGKTGYVVFTMVKQ